MKLADVEMLESELITEAGTHVRSVEMNHSHLQMFWRMLVGRLSVGASSEEAEQRQSHSLARLTGSAQRNRGDLEIKGSLVFSVSLASCRKSG